MGTALLDLPILHFFCSTYTTFCKVFPLNFYFVLFYFFFQEASKWMSWKCVLSNSPSTRFSVSFFLILFLKSLANGCPETAFFFIQQLVCHTLNKLCFQFTFSISFFLLIFIIRHELSVALIEEGPIWPTAINVLLKPCASPRGRTLERLRSLLHFTFPYFFNWRCEIFTCCDFIVGYHLPCRCVLFFSLCTFSCSKASCFPDPHKFLRQLWKKRRPFSAVCFGLNHVHWALVDVSKEAEIVNFFFNL